MEVWGPEHFSSSFTGMGDIVSFLLLSIYLMTRLASLLVVICSNEFQGVGNFSKLRVSRRHGVKDDG